MPNNDTPISSFQDATEINSADKLTGLQNKVNRNFSFSTILSWFVQTVAAAFVPVSRKVNNKALSADITLDASDVGAQGTITASGILKGDGAGNISAAVSGTDYQAPLTAGTDYATPAQLADKAAKADLTNIQATGTTNTTGAAIPAGAYFYLNGILHRAKEQIGTNVPFTVNTNCEQATISKMAEYWLDVTSQFSPVSGATLKVLVNPAIRKVKLFFLADGLSNGSTAVTIPTQYAPDTAKLVYVSSTDSYRIGIFHGRFTQTPSSLGNIYEFHSFLRYYSGNRQIAAYYPLANPAYAVTFDIEYVY